MSSGPAFLNIPLRVFFAAAFAAAIAGVAAEDVPHDATKEAAYATPNKVSIVISATAPAQDNGSAAQEKGPQLSIKKALLQSL